MKRLNSFGWVLVIAGLCSAAAGIEALVYWWDTYWAQWVAQNVLPPSVWTLLGVGLAHLHTHRKLDAQNADAAARHEDLKQHVTVRTTGERM